MPVTIGDLLQTAGVISPEQLQAARDYQKANRCGLGHALVTLGFVGDEEVAKLLSRLYDVPCVDLERQAIDPAVIRMLPADTARKYQVVPTALAGRVLTMAMADPTDVVAIDDVAFGTGCKVEPVVAPESALKAAIDRCYGSTSSVPTRSEALAAGGSVAHPTPTGRPHSRSPPSSCTPPHGRCGGSSP
jgi:type IV pilus assembly protein PilB